MTSLQVLVFLTISATHCASQKDFPRITSLTACTDIKHRFATTRISSHVVNPTNQSRQAVFDVTLPNDAFISNFTLEIGGKVYLAKVTQRDDTDMKPESYRTSVSSSSGRISQRPRETNKFRVSIQIGPQDGVSFNLTYQEILERRLGTYDHVLYIDPGQPVEDMRVDVTIEENRDITYLHVPPIRSDLLTDLELKEMNRLVQVERPNNRQAYISYHPTSRHQQVQGASPRGLSGLFTVRYDVTRELDAGDLLSVNGYFVHYFAPPLQRSIPKDVLFILDTSTSMIVEKLDQLKAALKVILSDMAPGDRFALLQFNTRAVFWRRQLLPLTPDNLKAALRYVDTLKARGYTNIDMALTLGLDFLNKESSIRGDNSMVIFLTDGRPTRGDTNREQILSNVRAQNEKGVAIYGLAFGQDADWPLVKRLALQNEGVGRRIYQDSDASLQIQGFYSELTSLLLSGVQAKYLESEVDLQTLTRSIFNKYFNGSELLVAGKLVHQNQTTLQVQVHATGPEGHVNLTVKPDPDPKSFDQLKSCGLMSVADLANITEKMWAYLTIRQMLQQRVREVDASKKLELQEKATNLAVKYDFVTPVTSLVVRKPGAEETAYLEEDASDLVDDNDLSPATETPEISSTTEGKVALTSIKEGQGYLTSTNTPNSEETASLTRGAVYQPATTYTIVPVNTTSRFKEVPSGMSGMHTASLPTVFVKDMSSSSNKATSTQIFHERTSSADMSPSPDAPFLFSTGAFRTRSIVVSPEASSTPRLHQSTEISHISSANSTDKGTSLPDETQPKTLSPTDIGASSTDETQTRTLSPTDIKMSSTDETQTRTMSPTDIKMSSTDETHTKTLSPIVMGKSPDETQRRTLSPTDIGTSSTDETVNRTSSLKTAEVSKPDDTRTRLPGANGTRRGGGGGDPHFMVEVGTMPYPLCFDVKGNTGDVYRLLKDPESGLTVNVELEARPHSRPGVHRVYIARVMVLYQDVVMDITRAGARVNGVVLEWNSTNSARAEGVWVMMEGHKLRFVLDWGAEIDVSKHDRRSGIGGDEFLNVEIQNEAQLSPETTGLLGQFAHKNITLKKMKRRDGRVVAEFDVEDAGHTQHGRAAVKQRRDPFFDRVVPCLMVDSLWSKTLDHPVRFYRLDSLFIV